MKWKRTDTSEEFGSRARRILWLVLWITSVICVSNKGGAVSYGFFFFVSSIPVVSYLYLFAVLFRLRISQSLSSRVMTAGEPMGYSLILRNEGFLAASSVRVVLFSDFSYVEKLLSRTKFELLPGEVCRYETNMICKYRGTYMVGVSKLILTDYLGTFTLTYKLPSLLEAIVNPRIPAADELKYDEEFSVWQKQENRQLWDEPDMLVREYESGDSLRRIHWNATAATGKLKTRIFTGEQPTGVVLYLDTRRESEEMAEYLPIENRLLELVLAFSQYYMENRQPVTVFCEQAGASGMGETVQKDVTRFGDFEDLYEELKEIHFQRNPERDGLQEFVTQCRRMPERKKVILFLQKLTEQDAGIIGGLPEDGTELTICLPSDRKEDAKRLSDLLVIPFTVEGRLIE